ncbi:MAG: hypothetical protein GY765_04835 [bacterium]|nr:hypothetical protein [bacterium]
MIQKVNYFFTRLFDVILYPFSFIPEFFGVLFLSALMSLVVLVLYKYLSSPSAIKDTKNQIKANILAIRLYKDFGKVIALSFFKSLFYTFKYFLLNFGPVLLIIPILFPTFAQMDVRYGMRPFQVGETINVKSAYAKDPIWMDVKLEESEHFKPVMNPIFINAFEDEEKTIPIREVNWKIKAEKEGVAAIALNVNGEIFKKQLVIGKYRGALSNQKYKASSWWHFFYPVETLLTGSDAPDHIYIRYPGKDINVLGMEINWLILNLILVLVLVLAFHKRFGVEF